MTIQALGGTFPYPADLYGWAGNDLTTPFTIDATGEKIAAIFKIPKTGTISKIWFNVGTLATGGNMDGRLETVSTTTGQPTGTLIAAGANHVQNVTATGGQLLTLDTGPAVTRGDIVALVVSASAAVDMTLMAGGDNQAQFPYGSHNTASSWTNNKRVPDIALEYDDGSSPNILGVLPYETAAVTFFTSSSNPDEWAMKFKLPIGFRIAGFFLAASAGTQAANTDYVLYDSDGSTVLETVTPDFDVQSSSSESAGLHKFYFTSSHELLADTFYYLAVKGGANTVTMMKLEFDTALIMDAADGGDNVHAASQVDGGGWTDLPTTRIAMGVLIDGLDLVAGGGSSSILGAGGLGRL